MSRNSECPTLLVYCVNQICKVLACIQAKFKPLLKSKNWHLGQQKSAQNPPNHPTTLLFRPSHTTPFCWHRHARLIEKIPLPPMGELNPLEVTCYAATRLGVVVVISSKLDHVILFGGKDTCFLDVISVCFGTFWGS